MQAIEFGDDEAEVLQEILEHGLSELDVEVLRTDSREFKGKLRNRRKILEQLLEKVRRVPAGV